jgi:hypothetical protein
MSTQIHWAYIISRPGIGAPRVERASADSITVKSDFPGRHVVTFPKGVKKISCIASLSFLPGSIVATPRDQVGTGGPFAANQVQVLTFNESFHEQERDFTVVVMRRISP